ncbi:MAG: alpha-L-rhamnosidase, partial [Kiritimatiellae bacterium]|nr:alpha-L-rhamnosidase [Kiritimatiellia bacterium]
HSLLWVLSMQSAAAAERHHGDVAQSDYWLKRARRTFDATKRVFWDEGRGLFADDTGHTKWSEHAQSLAVVSGLMSSDDECRVFDGLISAPDLSRATVYFSHYLFSAYFRHGRGDLFLKKLDLWRDYVALGLKTPLESPGAKARSDCHAWGAHPIYHALTGLAGIRPDSPDYGTVLVAPNPGGLSFIQAKAPHPKGIVSADLTFVDGGVSGIVTLPDGVTGSFRWKGVDRALYPGSNNID